MQNTPIKHDVFFQLDNGYKCCQACLIKNDKTPKNVVTKHSFIPICDYCGNRIYCKLPKGSLKEVEELVVSKVKSDEFFNSKHYKMLARVYGIDPYNVIRVDSDSHEKWIDASFIQLKSGKKFNESAGIALVIRNLSHAGISFYGGTFTSKTGFQLASASDKKTRLFDKKFYLPGKNDELPMRIFIPQEKAGIVLLAIKEYNDKHKKG